MIYLQVGQNDGNAGPLPTPEIPDSSRPSRSQVLCLTGWFPSDAFSHTDLWITGTAYLFPTSGAHQCCRVLRRSRVRLEKGMGLRSASSTGTSPPSRESWPRSWFDPSPPLSIYFCGNLVSRVMHLNFNPASAFWTSDCQPQSTPAQCGCIIWM